MSLYRFLLTLSGRDPEVRAGLYSERSHKMCDNIRKQENEFVFIATNHSGLGNFLKL